MFVGHTHHSLRDKESFVLGCSGWSYIYDVDDEGNSIDSSITQEWQGGPPEVCLKPLNNSKFKVATIHIYLTLHSYVLLVSFPGTLNKDLYIL